VKNELKNISKLPIGIFDSGLGGLSICKEIVDILPNESIIYLADSENAPYGEKSKEEIIELSIKKTALLLSLNCKVIVIACNTATTNAINLLRENYNVPFIGIEPAIKSAALKTKTGKIGVLATKGTLASDLFLSTSNQFRNELEIIEVEGTGLVRLIEKGDIEETIPLLKKYIYPMLEQGVDNIVLGCSHYPFLIPVIEQIIPKGVSIIDSGEAVAKHTKKILENNKLLNLSSGIKTTTFYTNNNLEILEQFLNRIKLEGEASFLKF